MITLDEFKEMRANTTIPEKIKQVEGLIDNRLKKLANTPEKGQDGRYNKRYFYLAEVETSHDCKIGFKTSLGDFMGKIDEDLQGIVRKEIVSMYSEAGYDIFWEIEDVGFSVRSYVIRIKNI